MYLWSLGERVCCVCVLSVEVKVECSTVNGQGEIGHQSSLLSFVDDR